jgi:glycosyltransferase involved in cell wall biosynthesis
MVDSEATWRGGEGQLLLLMRGLLDEECTVGLAAGPDSEIRRRSRDLPVMFHPLRIGGGMDLASGWRLRGILRRGGYDLVHTHSSHAHSVASIAGASMRPRPRHVVSRRVDFAVAGNAFSAWKYRRGADLYLAISSGVEAALVDGGVDRSIIRRVPSGIDLAKFDAVGDGSRLRAEFGIEAGTRVVGNIAALAPHKSQSDLLRAAAAVCARREDVRFFVVGEGGLRRELEAQTAALGLAGRVTFTGFREDALEFLRIFDCFVMSSRLEGLGTSIMDAQAAGVPVVATRTGGIPDIVADGRTGLLVPPGDSAALAAAVERMLDDEALRNECVSAAVTESRGYDYRRMVYKTLAAYRDLLDGTIPCER